jgi:hypothetical protein
MGVIVPHMILTLCARDESSELPSLSALRVAI